MNHIPTLEVGVGQVLDLRFDKRTDIQPNPNATTICDMRDMKSVFADNTFALAKLAAVIEHVDADGQFETVQELYRILVPNGIVILQTPDLDYITARLHSEDEEERKGAEIQMTGGMRDEFDVHNGLMGKDSLRRLFELNGFETLWLRDGNEAGGSLDGAFLRL